MPAARAIEPTDLDWPARYIFIPSLDTVWRAERIWTESGRLCYILQVPIFGLDVRFRGEGGRIINHPGSKNLERPAGCDYKTPSLRTTTDTTDMKEGQCRWPA